MFQDLQHNLFLLTFDDKLGNAPPNDKDAKVGRVLDVGTGTGIWCVDFGDEHPEAEILGVDLSATFPELYVFFIMLMGTLISNPSVCTARHPTSGLRLMILRSLGLILENSITSTAG